jgi:Asp/Glu/hydantoin racemase
MLDCKMEHVTATKMSDDQIDELNEMASLVRMLTHARQSAVEVDAVLPAHFIDMAIDALKEKMGLAVVPTSRH